MGNNEFEEYDVIERPSDPVQENVKEKLEGLFEERKEEVFFSRQLEVMYEDEFFHWITNRALRELVEEGLVRSETRPLSSGGSIKIISHRSYRYYKRSTTRLVKLVEEYANPNIGAAIGLHGEMMVLEGFARSQFLMKGRNTRAFGEMEWKKTEHDLDFIFERDSVAYGVEVKNKLAYMDYDELTTKIEMCEALNIRPVFVVRMMPRTWINELVIRGGFGLILKYQLYPWTHKDLAKRVSRELGLPVDSPRTLEEGTIDRFVKWHKRIL
jgi:hypothetical protein